MCRIVAVRLDDSGKTLLGDGQEGVTGTSSLDSIYSDVDRPILSHEQLLRPSRASQAKGLTVPFLNPTLIDKALASSRCT